MISIFYYLRVVMAMYFRDPSRELKGSSSPSTIMAIGICVVVVLLMGLFPSPWLDAVASAKMLIAAQ